MTKIHVVSGFLGAGKTTLIKKLLKEAFVGQKIVLIENEFGEIGIDGGFLKDAGIQITEMNSGCICCSLVGDFGKALAQVLETYAPDHILIEPSGVGKLSDVTKAIVQISAEHPDVQLGGAVTVADASKCKIYMKNFGEFFNNQIENAQTIILSRTQNLSQDKLNACVAMIREHNDHANLITTPWDLLSGEKILAVIEQEDSFVAQLMKEAAEHHHHHDDDDDDECECHEHHHHHDDDDDECECHEHHHHHDDDDECECHEHHHHHDDDDDDECECHEHHHHHDDDDDDDECDDPNCSCHHHDGEGHHHHHHHHADEIFTSWGVETPRFFTMDEVNAALSALNDAEKYGIVLRAKGILPAADGSWIHFDFVPEENNVRTGSADYTGRLCVIGSKLNEDALAQLFHLK